MKKLFSDNEIFYLTDMSKGLIILTFVGIWMITTIAAKSDRNNEKIIEYRQPTASIVTKSFNTSYQLSQYRDAMVSYSVQIASSLTLSGGQSGTVNLQTSKDNGVSFPFVTVATQANNNTGTLILGVSILNTQSGSLTCFVPAGYYIRLQTVGASTFTWNCGMEVLL